MRKVFICIFAFIYEMFAILAIIFFAGLWGVVFLLLPILVLCFLGGALGFEDPTPAKAKKVMVTYVVLYVVVGILFSGPLNGVMGGIIKLFPRDTWFYVFYALKYSTVCFMSTGVIMLTYREGLINSFLASFAVTILIILSLHYLLSSGKLGILAV